MLSDISSSNNILLFFCWRFWHSARDFFWHSFWHLFWHFPTCLLTLHLTFFLAILLTFFLAYLLTFFLSYLLTYLAAFSLTYPFDVYIFWHSFWRIFWRIFWHSFWRCVSSHILSDMSTDILSGILSDILSGVSSDRLSGISSDISFDIFFYISPDILSDMSFDIHSYWQIFWRTFLPFVRRWLPAPLWKSTVEVPLPTPFASSPLRSGASGWGLALPNDLELPVHPGAAQRDTELTRRLTVEVRRCPLRCKAGEEDEEKKTKEKDERTVPFMNKVEPDRFLFSQISKPSFLFWFLTRGRAPSYSFALGFWQCLGVLFLFYFSGDLIGPLPGWWIWYDNMVPLRPKSKRRRRRRGGPSGRKKDTPDSDLPKEITWPNLSNGRR